MFSLNFWYIFKVKIFNTIKILNGCDCAWIKLKVFSSGKILNGQRHFKNNIGKKIHDIYWADIQPVKWFYVKNLGN